MQLVMWLKLRVSSVLLGVDVYGGVHDVRSRRTDEGLLTSSLSQQCA